MSKFMPSLLLVSGVCLFAASGPAQAQHAMKSMSDADLGKVAIDALQRAGLPVVAPVTHVVTRRLRQAYPIYLRGYDAPFTALDRWVSAIPGLLTFGRQGHFAHDNTHHALYMAYAAADCLSSDGRFDNARWEAYRRTFETHVVED